MGSHRLHAGAVDLKAPTGRSRRWKLYLEAVLDRLMLAGAVTWLLS
jgi:hypothetical protein